MVDVDDGDNVTAPHLAQPDIGDARGHIGIVGSYMRVYISSQSSYMGVFELSVT